MAVAPRCDVTRCSEVTRLRSEFASTDWIPPGKRAQYDEFCMEPTKPCPMCGGTVGIDAKRCLACGESLAPAVQKRTLLRAEVTTSGMIPGAIAGAVIGLVGTIHQLVSDPGFEISFDEIVGRIGLFGAIGGAIVGSGISAVWRFARRSNSDHPAL